jgi:hypothetical protein
VNTFNEGLDKALDAYDELTSQALNRSLIGRDGAEDYHLDARAGTKQAIKTLIAEQVIGGKEPTKSLEEFNVSSDVEQFRDFEVIGRNNLRKEQRKALGLEQSNTNKKEV